MLESDMGVVGQKPELLPPDDGGNNDGGAEQKTRKPAVRRCRGQRQGSPPERRKSAPVFPTPHRASGSPTTVPGASQLGDRFATVRLGKRAGEAGFILS